MRLAKFPYFKAGSHTSPSYLGTQSLSAEITGLGHHPQLILKLFNSSANNNLKYLKPYVKVKANM